MDIQALVNRPQKRGTKGLLDEHPSGVGKGLDRRNRSPQKKILLLHGDFLG